MKRYQKVLFILANGYILLFFSEMMFWGHMALKDLPMTLLAYSMIGFVFLTAVTHFRIQEKWGLFLAGALFGWLAEGVLVQTTYEGLPLSLSLTGLSWHALLTIWLGWYWLPNAIRQGSAWQVVQRAGATGVPVSYTHLDVYKRQCHGFRSAGKPPHASPLPDGRFPANAPTSRSQPPGSGSDRSPGWQIRPHHSCAPW